MSRKQQFGYKKDGAMGTVSIHKHQITIYIPDLFVFMNRIACAMILSALLLGSLQVQATVDKDQQLIDAAYEGGSHKGQSSYSHRR